MNRGRAISTARATPLLPEEISVGPNRDDTSFASLPFWVFLVLTWALAFGTQHDWYASAAAQRTAVDLATEVAEGSAVRRTGLPMMAIVGTVALVYGSRERLHRPAFSGWILLALFAWMTTSIMWSDQPELSVRRLIAFTCLMVSAFATAVVAYDRLPAFVMTFTSFNLLIGILAELSLGTFLPGTTEYRFGGTVHPNLQGTNLVLLIVSCIWMAFASRNRRRGLTMALACTAFAFLLLTNSRNSIVVLSFSLVFSFSVMAARQRGAGILFLAAVIVGSACSVLLLFDAFLWNASLADLATQTIATERDQGDPTQLTGRVDLWHIVLGLIAQRPWLGWGFEAFWSPERIHQISWELQWQVNQAHNMYLETLANIGIIGLTLYALAAATALIASIRRFFSGSDADGFGGALLIVAILHGTLESVFVSPAFPSYMVFIVLFRAGYLANHWTVRG